MSTRLAAAVALSMALVAIGGVSAHASSGAGAAKDDHLRSYRPSSSRIHAIFQHECSTAKEYRLRLSYLDTAAKGGDPDTKVSRADFAAAIHAEQVIRLFHSSHPHYLWSKQEQHIVYAGAVGRSLLEVNREYYKVWDVAAHGGSPDGLISLEDIRVIERYYC